MAENSAIEWTDHTFNPWVGCTQVGPGCDHCYAKALNKRTGGAHWGAGVPRRRTKDWNAPYRWNRRADQFEARHGRRQRVFCASMADVFDNEVPEEWRADLWQVIRDTPRLDWLLVTKRIGNAAAMLPPDWPHAFPHVMLIATVVNQAEADRDIPKLLATPAGRRGVSAEPLLGPVRFDHINGTACLASPASCCRGTTYVDALRGIQACERAGAFSYPVKDTTPRGLDWIIVGGESGSGARPMHPDWARAIRDQCAAAGTAFFFKQWGSHAPASVVLPGDHLPEDADRMLPASKARAGRLFDGRTHDAYPERAKEVV